MKAIFDIYESVLDDERESNTELDKKADFIVNRAKFSKLIVEEIKKIIKENRQRIVEIGVEHGHYRAIAQAASNIDTNELTINFANDVSFEQVLDMLVKLNSHLLAKIPRLSRMYLEDRKNKNKFVCINIEGRSFNLEDIFTIMTYKSCAFIRCNGRFMSNYDFIYGIDFVFPVELVSKEQLEQLAKLV